MTKVVTAKFGTEMLGISDCHHNGVRFLIGVKYSNEITELEFRVPILNF